MSNNKYISHSSDVFEDPNFPLAIHVTDAASPADWPLHTHEFLELEVMTRGDGFHVVEEGEYPICAGDAFVVWGNSAHGYRNRTNFRMINVQFELSFLDILDKEITELPGYKALFLIEPKLKKRHKFRAQLKLNTHMLVQVNDVLEHMLKESENKFPAYRSVLRSLFIHLVTVLSRAYSEVSRHASNRLLSVTEVIEYINAHYTEHIELETLAEISHFSVNQFLRVFKDATGHSPIEYIIRKRVLQSAELLKNNETKLTTIAYQLGFSDSSHFSRHFKKIMGVPPRTYRMRQQ